MKLFKKTAIALTVMTILVSGCKNPARDINVTVNTDIFKSPMLFQFVNAKKGGEEPKDFTVEIKGQNADLVRTPSGGKVFKASSGLLNLMLDRAANPTPNSPVKFTLIINTMGFAPTFQDVEITSATDPMLYKLAMVQYTNPAIGNGTIVATKTISNGTANSELAFTTATNTDLAQKAEITIASGTGFLDASGQPLGGSQLEARIVYTGTATNGKSPMATGGNIAKNVIGANGQPITEGVYFSPAGVATIDMFAGTKEVKSFTKPVNLDIEVNSNMVNPNTNQPIQENESIEVWSLNQETGQWKNESNGRIVRNTVGKLVARTQITHLSAFLFGNSNRIVPTAIPNSCNAQITINRANADVAQYFRISPLISNSDISLAVGEKTKTFQVKVGKFASHDLTATPVPTEGSQLYQALTTGVYLNLCDQKITFTFPAPPTNQINATIDLMFKCNNKDLRTGVNAMITINPEGAPADEAMVFTLVNGKARGVLVNGVTYNVTVAIDGKSYTQKFTATKNGVTMIPAPNFTGALAYNDETNTLKLIGLINKDCS